MLNITGNLEIEKFAWQSNPDSYRDYKIPPKKIGSSVNLVKRIEKSNVAKKN